MEHFKEAAKEAEKVMRGVFERTPLQKNEHLSAIYGADIWLKREDLSPVRSYKLRGAFNAMRKQEKNKLFVAASAGNHAQGCLLYTSPSPRDQRGSRMPACA